MSRAPYQAVHAQMTERHLQELEQHLAPVREQLLRHPVYATVDSEARLRVFMEHHVFAVWDFMSLLKTLQRHLTCISVPWLPTADVAARRLINEIVLAEESDVDGRGGHLSHFEIYLAAMEDAGADLGPVRRLCAAVARGVPIGDLLTDPTIPSPVLAFVMRTFDVIRRGRPVEVAAAFTFGREDVIPDMFRRFVATLSTTAASRFERLRFYLERHIEIDGAAHGPKARELISALCGDDPVQWAAARDSAERAIYDRIHFWDGVDAALTSPNNRGGRSARGA